MTSTLQAISGNMAVNVFPDRAALGRQAAADIAAELRQHLLLARQVRMIFAAAPSQQETLAALILETGIDWSRITAFHMDEYIGLPDSAPQRFGNWLQRELFSKLPFGRVHLLQPDAGGDAIAAYAALLDAAPIDLVCMGIGVNGHLAFNDPPVADFADPHSVKVVQLDLVCRQQQVDDGCFASLDAVPTRAVTLTIPRLLDTAAIFCMVPGKAKAHAVRSTLYDPITTVTPATVLRKHANCRLYLDVDSAPAA
ncbi:6-phosphogluconolactonase [Glaciimonas soli]|uniref:Glucosamine-6-phosphate deaminase n=1 Tax=Glaciimonas soli TaxID=2590999 RepID=A0A843YVR2_9BURK|nr:6-phosphogluconolactonase [Glaciimonas soli]MQR02067.1 glucosamine-6-phosphate deaminase [Glaciimonas soli]